MQLLMSLAFPPPSASWVFFWCPPFSVPLLGSIFSHSQFSTIHWICELFLTYEDGAFEPQSARNELCAVLSRWQPVLSHPLWPAANVCEDSHHGLWVCSVAGGKIIDKSIMYVSFFTCFQPVSLILHGCNRYHWLTICNLCQNSPYFH